MQKVGLFLFAFTVLFNTAAFTPAKEKVNWISISELQEQYSKNPKPILFDVYTGWCGWCKVMDKETYGKQTVATYINEHYYAVKLDAESKQAIVWNGKKYEYNAQYKSNDFAMWLLYGQMSFPTTVFLSDIDARPAPLSGYLEPKEIEPLLKFFGDGAYKTQKYPEFMSTFKSAW